MEAPYIFIIGYILCLNIVRLNLINEITFLFKKISLMYKETNQSNRQYLHDLLPLLGLRKVIKVSPISIGCTTPFGVKVRISTTHYIHINIIK